MTPNDTIEEKATSTILTVSSLTNAIKNLLEMRYPSVTVQGEISNFKPHQTGHYYFDLKDQGAKVPAVMFRGNNFGLPRLPKEGDSVVVTAQLTVYPPQGKYQLVVKSLQFQGIGQLLLELEERKRKLKALGWFEKERKKPLPPFPKRIGIVTSPTGAVIRDILHVLARRHSSFSVLVAPVKVQGREAAGEIQAAIEYLNARNLVDCIILARGGGSLEDLWPFNEEAVAAALFASKIPVISAVGHETDFTIADFVADVRAPTPSAAAEIVMQEKAHHLQFLAKIGQALQHTLLHLLANKRAELKRFATHPLFASPYALLGLKMQRLDELRSLLDLAMRKKIHDRRLVLAGRRKETAARKPTLQLSAFRMRLVQLTSRLDSLEHSFLELRREKLKQIVRALASLDPKNVLQRGYSILFAEKTGAIVVSSEHLGDGERVKALLSHGTLLLEVKK